MLSLSCMPAYVGSCTGKACHAPNGSMCHGAQMQGLASGVGTVLGTCVRIPCEVLKQRLQARARGWLSLHEHPTLLDRHDRPACGSMLPQLCRWWRPRVSRTITAVPSEA